MDSCFLAGLRESYFALWSFGWILRRSCLWRTTEGTSLVVRRGFGRADCFADLAHLPSPSFPSSCLTSLSLSSPHRPPSFLTYRLIKPPQQLALAFRPPLRLFCLSSCPLSLLLLPFLPSSAQQRRALSLTAESPAVSSTFPLLKAWQLCTRLFPFPSFYIMAYLLIENEVEKIEDSANRDVFNVIIEHVEHFLLDFVGFVDRILETEAVIQELGKGVGAE